LIAQRFAQFFSPQIFMLRKNRHILTEIFKNFIPEYIDIQLFFNKLHLYVRKFEHIVCLFSVFLLHIFLCITVFIRRFRAEK